MANEVAGEVPSPPALARETICLVFSSESPSRSGKRKKKKKQNPTKHTVRSHTNKTMLQEPSLMS